MDLVSLIAACTIGGFDPEITRAVVTLSSYGEPWSYRIEGERNAKVFQSPEAAISGAKQAQELGKAVRVGLGGIEVDLKAATAQPNEAMFSPCVNLSITTKRLGEAATRCEAAGRAEPDYCAVGVYFGSWEKSADDMIEAAVIQVAVQVDQPVPQIKDYGAPAIAAPIDNATGSELSEEDRQRQEFLEGGGGLFPKATTHSEELKEDPDRAMIFGPGQGFGKPAKMPTTKETGGGEAATVLTKPEAAPTD